MSIYVGAGPLRTLAELQRKVQARTAAGGTEVTWVKERDIWCRIKGLSPRLKLEAMAREPQITHEIVVRQELGLDATKRIVIRRENDGTGIRLLDGIKFFYRCDELSGTRVDAGPNGLDVAQIGTVGNVAGIRSFGVNGTGNTSNYLEAAHNDLFRVPGAFTLSYWTFIPAGTLTTNHPAIGHWNTTAPNAEASWLAYMRNADDRHTFEVSDDGIGANVVRVAWGSAPSVDTWQHVVCVFDPDAETIGISVDRGTFVTTAFTGPIFAATAPLGITSARLSSHIVGLGDVDEIGAWDRVLNTEELDHLNTAPDFNAFMETEDRVFMIAGTPEDVEERGRYVRLMAVEGVAT